MILLMSSKDRDAAPIIDSGIVFVRSKVLQKGRGASVFESCFDKVIDGVTMVHIGESTTVALS